MSNNSFDKFKQIASCVSQECQSLNWLIVMPKITMMEDQQYSFPIGLAYVSSALKATGRNVFTLNLNYKKEASYDLLLAAIEKNSIDIVATGGITIQYHLVKEILDIAKQIKPDIVTVAGGGLITSEPAAAMTALECADFGIIGEGEITICQLAQAFEQTLDYDTINGLIYKNKADKWVITSPRREIDDLDIIPWPDYGDFEYEQMLSKTPLDILTSQKVGERMGFFFYSRSCPYNCTFCFHSSGKKYRTRTLDSFFEEFEYVVKKYSINSFFLADEYFIRNIKFIREFCQRIKPYKMRWSCSGRVDNITVELLEELKDAGCYRIGFGVESANDHILKSMRKHITRAQIENAFSLCQEVGIEAQGNLIFGDLEETTQTAMDTINWWVKHQNWALTMHWIIPYPGSHVYKVACERGIISDPVQFIKDRCPEVNFSKMTTEERRHIAATIDALTSENHDVLKNAFLSPGQSGKVTATGDCPYCSVTATYLNLDPIRPIKLEICTACNRTLRLYAQDYMCIETIDDNVKAILASNKIAFWPVVAGFSKWIERIPSLTSDNIFVIDSSTYKQGLSLSGKTVYSPDVIKDYGIDIVFVTTTTSVGMEIISQIQTNFPYVKRVELIGNLFFALQKGEYQNGTN